MVVEFFYNLGFDKVMMNCEIKVLFGGWRMRVFFARVFLASSVLFLFDELMNYLDLSVCVWFEDYLLKYKKCLVVILYL